MDLTQSRANLLPSFVNALMMSSTELYLKHLVFFKVRELKFFLSFWFVKYVPFNHIKLVSK